MCILMAFAVCRGACTTSVERSKHHLEVDIVQRNAAHQVQQCQDKIEVGWRLLGNGPVQTAEPLFSLPQAGLDQRQ